MFAAVFRLRCMFVLSFVFWYVCSRLFLFPFSLAFCSTKMYVKHYANFCMFMQSKNVCLCNVLW